MNVVIDMPVYAPLLARLQAISGIQVQLVEPPEEKMRPLPHELLYNCDVLFGTFPPQNHGIMQQLKLIQIPSSGYTQLIKQGFTQRGIRCCNALGVFDVPIAEWNVAMMINLARNMRELLHNQDKGLWDRHARFQREIRGSVVGIWGYGGIGRETARLVKQMGLTVHVLTRAGIKPRNNIYRVEGTGDPDGLLPDKIFMESQNAEFLSGLDFLILAMPQTSANTGIIGEAELRLLKPTAFLLNPARGALVNEQALIKALRENWIAGAALDTHYYYPMPADHPLWQMPNVMMTPHISGSSQSPAFLSRTWDILVQNIMRLMQGRSLLNELHAGDLEE